MSNSLILDLPWADDLHPDDVPFLERTVTILRRKGYFDNPSMFDTLTVSEVAGWWNAGPVTVEDIRVTGRAAIRRHLETADLRRRMDAELAAAAQELWAPRIWHPDPRFAEFVPKGNSTVYYIAVSGTAADRRVLWGRLDGLRAAVDAQGDLSLEEAVSEYVEAVSGQHGQRLEVLLARTSLNGLDPITGAEGARRLGVSNQRIYQLVEQLHRGLARVRRQNGPWLPQVVLAEETGWPDWYTEKGVEATSRLT